MFRVLLSVSFLVVLAQAAGLIRDEVLQSTEIQLPGIKDVQLSADVIYQPLLGVTVTRAIIEDVITGVKEEKDLQGLPNIFVVVNGEMGNGVHKRVEIRGRPLVNPSNQ